jgi:hypothetical protein
MIRRTSQLAKRFTHNHNHNNITPNVFLPKNNYKIDYEKWQESEDSLKKIVKDYEICNKNILDIKKNVEFIKSSIELTAITIGSYGFSQIIAFFLFK